MVETFDSRAAEVRLKGGFKPLASLWIRTFWDVFKTALIGRAFERRHDSQTAHKTTQREQDMISSFLKDTRYTLRILARRPTFTLLVTLTLGLGIGANTAIFSVINGVLLTPLAYEEPDQLVRLWSENPSRGLERYFVAPVDYLHFQREMQTIDGLAGYYRTETSLLDTDGNPVRLPGGLVTGNLFQMLGVRAIAGRTLEPIDTEPDAPPTIVISHGLWQRWFAADPNVAGTTLPTPAGGSVTIVGVLPEDFDLPGDAEVWSVFPNLEQMVSARDRFMDVVARVKPEHSISVATSEFASVMNGIAESDPERNQGWRVTVAPMKDVVVAGVSSGLWILFGSAGMIMLIACANVANLLLSRAEGRQREIAIRSAMGAGRRRIVRQLMTESMVFSTAGALTGLTLAALSVEFLIKLGPQNLPRLVEVGIDSKVLVFALVTTVVTGFLFGLVPVLRLMEIDLQSPLKDGGRGVAGKTGGDRFRDLLVVSQVAVSVILVIGAGLLIKSFYRLQATDPGFTPAGAVSLELTLPGVPPGTDGPYSTPQRVADFYNGFVEQIEQLPRVLAAGAGSTLPLGVPADYPARFWVAGRDVPAPGEESTAYYRQVTPGFFEALETPLINGRFFSPFDRSDSPGVVVINQAAASRFWPGQDPLGQRLYGVAQPFGPLGEMLIDDVEIVGIIRDVKYEGLDIPVEPSIYFPHQQAPFRRMTIAARFTGDPQQVVDGIRTILREMDSSLPVSNIHQLTDLLDQSVAQERFSMLLLASFGALAIILASVGIYGVLSFSVARRTSEFGIRMALGASRQSVMWAVVKKGMSLTTLGLILGTAGAVGISKAVSSVLHDVSQSDPWIFASVLGLVTIVASISSLLPAYRALQTSPLEALRQD